MIDFILSYLAYNVLLGIVLTIFHLVRENGNIRPISIAWLFLFPAAGLGKWFYTKECAKGNKPEFPEMWFMWKYMIKVNWGYMGLIGILPVFSLALISLGVVADGMFGSEINSIYGVEEMLQVGVFLLIFLVLIISVAILFIPFLLLISFPKYQKRRIEKAKYSEVLYEKMQQKKQEDKTRHSQNRATKNVPIFSNVDAYIKDCIGNLKSISEERKNELDKVAAYIKSKLINGEIVTLTFICTHNSRRSQFGQIWAATAAAYLGVRNIQTYSGGTEETSFNAKAVSAIKRAGFTVDKNQGTNPHYFVRFSDVTGALECFSKTFDNPVNPQKGFAAIMTCSNADEDCPVVLGAEFRAPIMYDDPKVADGTLNETATYDERCKQIATEMLYLFGNV